MMPWEPYGVLGIKLSPCTISSFHVSFSERKKGSTSFCDCEQREIVTVHLPVTIPSSETTILLFLFRMKKTEPKVLFKVLFVCMVDAALRSPSPFRIHVVYSDCMINRNV